MFIPLTERSESVDYHNRSPYKNSYQIKIPNPSFQKRECELDQLNSFPYQNIKDLKEIGYTTLTLPEALGGEDITLTDFLVFQDQIAKGCGSTALSIGWHMGTVLEFAEHQHWNPELVPLLVKEIQNGALINTAFSERNAGSPLRGAKPTTIAVLSADKHSYIITGEKTFTSAAPVLDIIFVTAKKDDGQVLLSSREFLYAIAAKYEKNPEKDFKAELAAVKTCVTNNAIEIVDLAMRIVGARSLSQKNPLHRYYQNIRAGLHNPPMDDITYQILAESALRKE